MLRDLTIESIESLGVPALLPFIRLSAVCGQEVYLVGGFLRDLFLYRRAAMDVDLVVSGDPLILLKEWKKSESGHFIPLDPDFGIYRLFVGSFTFDIARMQGESIEEDLSRRDFSINALGLGPLNEPDFAILDPAKGLRDLEEKKLRAISRQNLIDDPLRLLRAFRFAATLGFSIEQGTCAWIKELAPRIEGVSAERIAVELNKMLSSESADTLDEMRGCGLMEAIFPEMSALEGIPPNEHHQLGAFAHSIEVVRQLEGLLEKPAWLGSLEKDVFEYLHSTLAKDRKVLPALKLAALLHDIGKPSTYEMRDDRPRFIGHDREGAMLAKNIARRLKLSVKETLLIEAAVRHHMRPGLLAAQGETTPKAIYRFFRDTGSDGVAILLLSLADRLAAQGPAVTQLDNEKNYSLVLRMLDDFFKKPEKVRPAPLLDGKEVMEIMETGPGPRIGKWLEALTEAQVIGQVRVKSEAIAWLLRQKGKKE